MANDFVERARRELSAEELSGLRVYSATTEGGRVIFMPIIRGFGRQVHWQARAHIKGASGPLPVTNATLKAIGAPEDWGPKSKAFLEALRSEYPSLGPGFPERKALGEGDSE